MTRAMIVVVSDESKAGAFVLAIYSLNESHMSSEEREITLEFLSTR